MRIAPRCVSLQVVFGEVVDGLDVLKQIGKLMMDEAWATLILQRCSPSTDSAEIPFLPDCVSD